MEGSVDRSWCIVWERRPENDIVGETMSRVRVGVVSSSQQTPYSANY